MVKHYIFEEIPNSDLAGTPPRTGSLAHTYGAGETLATTAAATTTLQNNTVRAVPRDPLLSQNLLQLPGDPRGSNEG